MIPDRRGLLTQEKAFGIAYRVEENGDFTELWKVSGWASGVFLSNDGQYLVRMGPWNVGHEPTGETPLLVYIKNFEPGTRDWLLGGSQSGVPFDG